VDLHCSVVLVAGKIEQLQTEGLDFRRGGTRRRAPTRFFIAAIADRLRQGLATSKRADSNSEIVALLTSAMGQGSAQATVQLAQIYRTGELGTNKKPIEAMRLAYHAIDLEIATDPTDPLANPYNMARQIVKSGEGRMSRRLRKKVVMLFAHLKRILRLDRLRLRGPNGARGEFLLAATAQNLRKLAKLIPMLNMQPA
jgi:hypothetical protein